MDNGRSTGQGSITCWRCSKTFELKKIKGDECKHKVHCIIRDWWVEHKMGKTK